MKKQIDPVLTGHFKVLHWKSFPTKSTSTSRTMPNPTKASGPKPFECPICKKRFAYEKSKNTHVVAHEVGLQSNELI